MGSPMQRVESLHNLGGINTKVSTYITGVEEFLDLVNLDFTTPGALTLRWGSTQYIGLALPDGRATSLYEYNKLNGLSKIIITGSSYAFFIDGTSYTSFRTGSSLTFQNTNTPTTIILGATLLYDMTTTVDFLFAANGKDHWKYDGNTSYFYSLPDFRPAYSAQALGTTCTAGVGAGSGPGNTIGAFTGFFYYLFGFLNNRGYISGADRFYRGPSQLVGQHYGATYFNGFRVLSAGHTNIQIDFTVAPTLYFERGYGITAIVVYRGGPTDDGTNQGLDLAKNLDFYQVGIANGSTPIFFDNYLPNGELMPTSLNFNAWTYDQRDPGVTQIYLSVGQTLVPKYVEVYNSQYFMAGFSALQSTIGWSEVGEPERIEPDNFDEVRTDDGDRITGLKVFLAQLVISKKKSMHRLTGNNAENLNIAGITNDYGCISNRAMAIYKDYLLFLDQQAVVRYNGANVEPISYRVQHIIDRINLDAAIDNAVAIHFKERTEVWFGVPIDGSLINNFTLVYNYEENAWTTFQGFIPGIVALARGRLSKETVMYGDYSGLVFNFGASLTGDNGSGITRLFKTRFIKQGGVTEEGSFRRFEVSCDPVAGSNLTVEFMPNYGSTVTYTSYIPQDNFLNRIDFGVSATSLSLQVSRFSATETFRLHAFTVEHRFQRGESVSNK